jgi:hypothetical protein
LRKSSGLTLRHFCDKTSPQEERKIWQGAVSSRQPGRHQDHGNSNNGNIGATLYIETRRGHTPKDDIEKNTFVCYQIFSKKKPPVRDKSMFHHTQILKQEVSHERRRSYQTGRVSSIQKRDSEIGGVFDRWH